MGTRNANMLTPKRVFGERRLRPTAHRALDDGALLAHLTQRQTWLAERGCLSVYTLENGQRTGRGVMFGKVDQR